MDVFIGEYVCGGGHSRRPLDQIPRAQREEGLAMLRCIAEDFSEVADSVHVAIDPRFEIRLPSNVVVHPVATGTTLWVQWIAAAAECDTALLIAPESDGLLAQSVAMLQSTGVRVLNGFGDFLRSASDKWETARILSAAGVPHPPTWTVASLPAPEAIPSAQAFVVKPRDGCGTDDVRIFPTLEEAIAAAEHEGRIIQPWVEGRPASVAVVVEANDMTVLPAVSQAITSEDCNYRGGRGPLGEEDQRRAANLARLAIRALPRTIRGFIGFDLVLADDPERDCVIEVNPRLTTSYVGLRHIVEGNLAARIAGLDRSPVRCAAHCGEIRWNASGEVWVD